MDTQPLEWRTIEALGTVIYDVNLEVKCRDNLIQVYVNGIDNNGRGFQLRQLNANIIKGASRIEKEEVRENENKSFDSGVDFPFLYLL